MTEESVAILTLNVCSPSKERAERVLEWLDERPEHVFVLSETSPGVGTKVLTERMRESGWEVRAPRPSEGERGVMICSRLALGPAPRPPASYLPERTEAVSVGGVELIGAYTPSRDDSPQKVARKRHFLSELLTVLGSRNPTRTVMIGDLNIVERSNRQVDKGFQEWEYELYEELPTLGWLDAYRALHPDRVEISWSDTEGRGYRFDHAFITSDLRSRLRRCEYLHETRETDLSDHSAMVIELESVAAESLEVDNSLGAGPPSLF